MPAILVTSGKGGTGKTTVSAGISSALALAGRTVVAIDADFGLRNLDLYLGLYDRAIFDLRDVALGRVSVADAITPHPSIPGLSLLASPSGIDAEVPPPVAMRAIIAQVKTMCDYCIIDSPAGIGDGFIASAAGVDRAIIVTTPDLACVIDGAGAAMKLDELGVADARVVVNRVRPRLIRRGHAYNLDQVMDRIGLPLLGYIREDEALIRAANACIPVMLADANRRKGAVADIADIAARIEGRRVLLR